MLLNHEVEYKNVRTFLGWNLVILFVDWNFDDNYFSGQLDIKEDEVLTSFIS